MTCKERVVAALNHEEPDRVPMWTMIDSSAVLRKYAAVDADYDALIRGEGCRDQLLQLVKSAATALGIDVVFFGGGHPFNPFPREAEETSSNAKWETEFQTLEEVKAYTPEIPDYDEVAGTYAPLMREAVEVMGPEVMAVDQQGTCLEHAWGTLGLQTFSITLYDAPGEIARIMDAATERCRIFAQVYADYELSFAYQISGDIAYKGGTMFSLDFLKTEYIPRLARQLEPLKQAGIKVVYHSDGDVTEIIDGLIEAGVDALNPIEPTAGMDLAKIKKRYGRNLVLVGNVDPNIMTIGEPTEVEADVKRCIRDAAKGGGLFIDSGAGELMPWFPVENIEAMCRAVHEHGRYPVVDPNNVCLGGMS